MTTVTCRKTENLHGDEPRVLFSRYEDGTRPVTLLPSGDWELPGSLPGAPPQRFSTAKGLLVALTGHPEGRHWSLERYFRQGPKHGTTSSPRLVTDIYDFWPACSTTTDPVPLICIATTPGISIPQDGIEAFREPKTILSDAENVILAFRESKTILSAPENHGEATQNLKTGDADPENVISAFRESKTIFPVPEMAEKAIRETGTARLGTQRGIDLVRRSHEVRKLLFAGFGRRMYACGYDPEDVLHEVYKGILIRNRGKCPWDPAKSSFGHYVHMVCSCILNNYHRKQRRVREMEQVGLLNPLGSDGPERYTDVASNVTVASRNTLVQEDCLMLEEAEDLLVQMQSNSPQDAESRLAAKVLPLLLAGTPREDIASSLGVSPASLSRAMSHLRKQATAWAASAH